MKSWRMAVILALAGFGLAMGNLRCSLVSAAEVAPEPTPPAEVGPAPPPSAPPRLSAAQLEAIAAPIALYPDPLLAILLPASAYPFEIVQAARFIKDTNNIPKVDEQPWDSNVKALVRFPDVIQKLDEDLPWTSQLSQAFVQQPEEFMNAIQVLRAKAQAAGTLKTTGQQIVIVTNAIVERTYEQQIVYVTNTIVEIQPSNPQIIYVPQYNPTIVYAPPPAYVNPWAPLLTFGAGIAVGAIIANNCNWYYGGIWVGGHGTVVWRGGHYHPYYPPPPGYRPPPYHPPPGYRPPPPGYRPPGVPPPGARPPATQLPAGVPSTLPATASGQRWQPDQGRLAASGSPSSPPGVSTREARGWGASSGAPAPSTRPATGTSGNRPTTGAVGSRPSTGTAPSFNRPTTTPSPSTTPGTGGGMQRPAAPSQSINRPTQSSSSGGAFGVSNASAARDSSSRGNASRGGYSGGQRSGGAAGRGGRR